MDTFPSPNAKEKATNPGGPILRSVPVRGGTVQVADLLIVNYAGLKAGDPNETAKLLQATTSDGFFHLDLTNSVAEETVLGNLQCMYKIGRDYFAQPDLVKRKDERIQDASIDRGYKRFHGLQTFEVARDELFKDDLSLPDSIEPFRQSLKDFSSGMDEACRVLLRLLSYASGAGDCWESYHDLLLPSESGLKFAAGPTLVRVADVHDNQHTDGGTFTALFGKEMSLQAYLRSIKAWAFVLPQPGCALVNVGDDLEHFSAGRLHSPRHRVTQAGDGEGERFFISHLLRPSHE